MARYKDAIDAACGHGRNNSRGEVRFAEYEATEPTVCVETGNSSLVVRHAE
jgi:hypothetical protein